MALLAPASAGPKTKEDVGREMEAMLIKQMLTASGAFHKTSTAGSSVTADLFIDTLSEAIAKSGQLGLSGTFAHALSQPVPPTPSTSPSSTTSALASALTAAPNHLTSGFGLRADPIDGHLAQHQGIDLGAPEGTPILAAADGVVQSAGLRGGYGQAVEIQHAGGVSTLYAHASALMVHAGQHITKGQTIGLVGQTGRATGPHLHFEVRVGHRAVNPSYALKAYGQRADSKGE